MPGKLPFFSTETEEKSAGFPPSTDSIPLYTSQFPSILPNGDPDPDGGFDSSDDEDEMLNKLKSMSLVDFQNGLIKPSADDTVTTVAYLEELTEKQLSKSPRSTLFFRSLDKTSSSPATPTFGELDMDTPTSKKPKFTFGK